MVYKIPSIYKTGEPHEEQKGRRKRKRKRDKNEISIHRPEHHTSVNRPGQAGSF
jgi:hypothetical protein